MLESTVVFLMAMLSMNLGIINLLPIPALDGGKIVLNIIEGVRGKPISPEKRHHYVNWLWVCHGVNGVSYLERYSTLFF